MGTRDIDSTPPARIRSSQPERMRAPAWLTASRPEPQKRFSCTPATSSGQPAAMTAVRARSMPWSPTGETTPVMTSSMRDGSSSGLRDWTASSSVVSRDTGLTVCREPVALPLPRGVRIES